MNTWLTLLFVLAYAAIALEHPLRVNKTAIALLAAGVLWTVYALYAGGTHVVPQELGESLAGTAQIVLFLMGAMAIVEVIDAHNGFEVLTSRVRTESLPRLVWLVGLVTFFLSAVLDNLTTTIVMLSLMKKLLQRREDRLLFAGFIVIAANAGGAWTPIGDVTTTMLWIGGQITALPIMKGLFVPALVSLLVPLAVLSWRLRGQAVKAPARIDTEGSGGTSAFERQLMFGLGLGILMAVPAFKAFTGLPPFMGILLGLGVLWLVGDLVHRHKDDEAKTHLTLVSALQRIDMSAVLFFVGILLAVATLEHAGLLADLAQWLEQVVGRQDLIVLLIGLVSAVVDNVPLVAAAMGMYSLQQFPADSFLWAFLAYCAGTGGSILIIGSAAGVAAMGLEKIDFFWYVRKISPWALMGYLAGAGAYVLQQQALA